MHVPMLKVQSSDSINQSSDRWAKSGNQEAEGQMTEKLERTEYPVNETFDDSEDEFYAHRDKILVDEAPAAKRRRKLEEQYADLQPSDEEVFEDANGGRSDEDDEALNEVVASGSDEDPDTARRQIEDEEDERLLGHRKERLLQCRPH